MVDFVADSVDFVAGFGDKSAKTWSWQLVTVDIVVHLVNFVGDTVDFVAESRQCVRGQSDKVDFQQSQPCWIQLGGSSLFHFYWHRPKFYCIASLLWINTIIINKPFYLPSFVWSLFIQLLPASELWNSHSPFPGWMVQKAIWTRL